MADRQIIYPELLRPSAAISTPTGNPARWPLGAWMAQGSYHWHGALVHLAACRTEQARQAADAALELLAGVSTHPLHRMATRLRDLLESTSSLPAPSMPESRALILDLLRPE